MYTDTHCQHQDGRLECKSLESSCIAESYMNVYSHLKQLAFSVPERSHRYWSSGGHAVPVLKCMRTDKT